MSFVRDFDSLVNLPGANLSPQASNPGGTQTLWTDSGDSNKLKLGALTVAMETTAATFGALTADSLTVAPSSGDAVVSINGATGGDDKTLCFQTNGVDRWCWLVSGAEGGSDAGSLISLVAKTDAGADIDSPISIVRAAGGLATHARPTTFTDTTTITSETVAAVTVANMGVDGYIYARGITSVVAGRNNGNEGFGLGALGNYAGSDERNTALGNNALGASTGTYECTALGAEALLNLVTSSSEVTAVGTSAGRAITTVNGASVAIGNQIANGTTRTVEYFVGVGPASVDSAANASLTNSILMGTFVGRNLTVLTDAVLLGHNVATLSTSVTSSIIIGNDAASSSAAAIANQFVVAVNSTYNYLSGVNVHDAATSTFVVNGTTASSGAATGAFQVVGGASFGAATRIDGNLTVQHGPQTTILATSTSVAMRAPLQLIQTSPTGANWAEFSNGTSTIWVLEKNNNDLLLKKDDTTTVLRIDYAQEQVEAPVSLGIGSTNWLNLQSVGVNTTLTRGQGRAIATADSITIDLWATPTTGDEVAVRNASGTGAITVDGNGNNIDGAATKSLADGEAQLLIYNGTQWIGF